MREEYLVIQGLELYEGFELFDGINTSVPLCVLVGECAMDGD